VPVATDETRWGVPSMSRSAIGWAAAIVLAGAGLAGAAEAPSPAEILAILYPGGQMTFDDEGHHVIRGGRSCGRQRHRTGHDGQGREPRDLALGPGGDPGPG